MRFNPPPNWPAPPRGWEPGPQWRPDPAWGPPPQGWRLWVAESPPTPRPEPTPSIQATVVPTRSNATNTMAIAAIVFAVLLPPAGLGLGVAARRQIRRTHEGGAALAKVAVILAGVLFAVYVIGGIAALTLT